LRNLGCRARLRECRALPRKFRALFKQETDFFMQAREREREIANALA